jgi:hypothetical protein
MFDTSGDKKHEPSELNYYTFGDELTHLGINSLSFPLANGCCTPKMSILDEKLSTQDHILLNEFSRILTLTLPQKTWDLEIGLLDL